MKQIKKTAILLIIAIIILGSIPIINTSNAVLSIDKADLYSKGVFTDLLYLGNVKIGCEFVVYKKDGTEYPAYCLDKDLNGVEVGSPYSVSVDSLMADVRVWRVLINGYPYKTYSELGCDNANEAYLATKQAVYCILYDRNPNDYTAIGTAGQKCLNALKTIVANAKSSTATKISSDITVKPEGTKWEIDKLNNKYISMTYTAKPNGAMNTYSVDIKGEIPEGTYIADEQNNKKTTFNNGEKFKILVPITNILKDGEFSINASGKVNTKPVLYGKSSNSSLQDYALTASVYEEGDGTSKAYYIKNRTTIKIIKQETDTKKPLKGAEFQLLDAKQNVVYTSLVTNDKGEVDIENLLPGTYYIKETRTLDGYTLYDQLIQVNLTLNESSKVTVNNSKQETKVEIIVSESEKEVTKPSTPEVIEVETPSSEKEAEQLSKPDVVEIETPSSEKEVEQPNKTDVIQVEAPKSEIQVTVKLPKTGM